jgi:hypothetical protein
MPKEDYPELDELFEMLGTIYKEKYKFHIFQGNKEQHGIKFILISVESLDLDSYNTLVTILDDAEFLSCYDGATDFSFTRSPSGRLVRLLIFFEELKPRCSFGLSNYTPHCDDICDNYKVCKIPRHTYEIHLKGSKSMGDGISLAENFDETLIMENISCAQRFVEIIKILIYNDSKDVEIRYLPKMTGDK